MNLKKEAKRAVSSLWICLALLHPITTEAVNASREAPKNGERLSDYLLRTSQSSDDYVFATEWTTPDSRLAQEALHRSLRLAMSDVPSNRQLVNLSSVERDNWAKWLSSEKPVGRITAPSFDARWLQANPQLDPLLTPDHDVFIPKRPRTVTVLKNSGGPCQVTFEPNRSALDYGKVCGEYEGAGNYVHLVQPDGRIVTFGIGLWNESAQVAPAPGAWIWIPDRAVNWPEEFNQSLLKFLAGQGIAKSQYGGDLRPRPLGKAHRPLKSYQDLNLSPSDWGNIGLLQTPTARLPGAGTATLSFSRTSPYTRANMMLSPFDWLEAGFRYTDVSNRLYGQDIAGDQSYKDKSIDAKFRVTRETEWIPQVAIGMRDMGGTGLFSGEYIVANKRFSKLDASIGIGWGYLGKRGNISNPLRIFSDRFTNRPQGSTGSNQGGEFNGETYFRGPVALFGGVQWQTPWDRWTIKLELDGNDYQSEPQSNNQTVDSPVNIGAVYRLGPHTQLSLGLERGNTLMLGVSFGTDLGKLSTPKISEPKPIPVQISRRPLPLVEMPVQDWTSLMQTLKQQTGWEIDSVVRRGKDLRIEVSKAPTFDWDAALDRANRVLHRLAPIEISRFTYVIHERGLSITEFTNDRDEWATRAASYVPEKFRINQPTVVDQLIEKNPVRDSILDQPIANQKRSAIAAGFGLTYSQSFGGPDAFILYQLSAETNFEWRLRDNTWITAIGRLALLDNYDKFKYTGPSNLPRVRTNVREYVTSTDITLPVLQGTHTTKLSDSWSAMLYGGFLEQMYAGIGGELLYRPFGSKTALGFDINRVRQRGFEQDFSLRDYEVSTGHATLYWHTGWEDIVAKLSAGQYLAGDRGVTVDLSRVFKNGVRVGAFATKTNVSAAEFGEGSFDKGIYVTIPFDAMMTKFSKSEALLLWKPLTRDGGAKLDRKFELYRITEMNYPN